RHASGGPDGRSWGGGALAWWGGGWGGGLAAGLGPRGAASLGDVAGGLLLGAVLKPMLSWRMLREEVAAVETALGQSLDAGRRRLGRLVSREVMRLDEAQVRESAIESLAENLNDSVVAPVFWFLVAGLPGAVVYRFANTADAMWGYPGFRAGLNWAWAGKWAARADDVLSWVPARLTALLLGIVCGGVPTAQLRAHARRTPSPNSGWPMAAMALGLGVCLRKPGVYALNEQGAAPRAPDTARAIALGNWAVALLLAWACVLLVAMGWARAA
ncbi:MAG: cobalamin biosynthesis protein, partial [Gemmatimonadetes bacterium]|nr:cobalamin biosynthesis protein [Gemmatimonadota bacterium]